MMILLRKLRGEELDHHHRAQKRATDSVLDSSRSLIIANCEQSLDCLGSTIFNKRHPQILALQAAKEREPQMTSELIDALIVLLLKLAIWSLSGGH